ILLAAWGAAPPPAMAQESAQQEAAERATHEAGAVQPAPSTTLIPDLRLGDATNYLEFYGQIDKGLLVYNDGFDTYDFFPVDNNTQPTLAGFFLVGTLDGGYVLTANLEAQWEPISTLNVSQLDPAPISSSDILLRKAEVYLKSDSRGTVWVGQGFMASYPGSQYDLSGTTVVALSAVEDIAGGLYLRYADGTFSPVRIIDAFNNYNGLGRWLRIRYDTPAVNGLYFSTSVGTVIVPSATGVLGYDVAAIYNNTVGDFQLSGSLAASVPEAGWVLINGSFSALHVPTGLSVTVAGAVEHTPLTNPHYGYVKLGYQQSWFDFGKTALSVDAYLGANIYTAGDQSRSIGAQLVQNIDYLQTELYVGARLYQYDDELYNYRDGTAVLAGAMVSF
ncbi:MAG: hypothetical protein JWQ89_1106, partial [Devosia sp.]|uniref:hypothetical protein n=1 Tax=Devosia sp. TaxID=1871048 RepID=UPI002630798A